MTHTERGGPVGVLKRGLSRLPGWVAVVLALGALALGALALGVLLLVRPTTSLGVLALMIGAGLVVAGGLELTTGARGSRVSVALAIAWILAGLFVLLHPGLTVRVLALVIGIALILRGAVGVLASFRSSPSARTLDGRVASALLGVAGILFGVVALAWPDITLLIAGVVFGAALAWTGIAVLVTFVRERRRVAQGADAGRPAGASDPAPLSITRRWLRTIGAVTVVLLAVGTVALSVGLSEGSRVTDHFYAAPRVVPAEPGQLIRAEEFTRGIPDDARAWRILYTTTRGDGLPAVASGLVIVPRTGSAHPVIAWNHGTTGFDQACAPTLATQPLESGAFFVIDRVVDEGWALVATDYVGLGTTGPHPYLVGAVSARAELDAVRAARQLDAADLGAQTVVWGHSQGGGSALWVGAIADEYAPDVPLAGVVALAPASDLIGLVSGLGEVTGGSVFASYVIAAYSDVYPDVRTSDYLRPGAEVTVRQMATRCLAAPGMLVSVLTLLALSEDPDILSRDAATGPLGDRLRENIPPATITVPVLLGQGESDGLILPAMQRAFASSLCTAGVAVDFRTYSGLDHIPLVEADSPAISEVLDWTRAALAGAVPAAPCP